MQKKPNGSHAKQTQAELKALELEFLSQVSGGKKKHYASKKGGGNPRDPKTFTTYWHPKTVVVTKVVPGR